MPASQCRCCLCPLPQTTLQHVGIITSACAVSHRGIWIFRGPGIPQIMLDECYDMELYDWVKADINDPVRRVLRDVYFRLFQLFQDCAHRICSAHVSHMTVWCRPHSDMRYPFAQEHHAAYTSSHVVAQACLSSSAQEQKKRIEDMIAEEATIDGLENVECKVFK